MTPASVVFAFVDSQTQGRKRASFIRKHAAQYVASRRNSGKIVHEKASMEDAPNGAGNHLHICRARGQPLLAPVPDPQTLLDIAVFDPFQCTAAPIGRQMSLFIDFYLRDLIPHRNTFRNQSSEVVKWATDLAITDEVFPYAICCLAATHMQSTTHHDLLFSALSRSILLFKHQTIVKLIQRLASPIAEDDEDPMPYSILALMATEIMAGKINEFLIHGEALVTALTLLQENQNKTPSFPQPIRRTLHFFLSMISLLTRRPPGSRSPDFMPSTITPASQTLLNDPSQAFHQFALTLLEQSTLLSPELISVTADLRLVVLFTETYRAHPHEQPLEEESDYIFYIVRSIDHRLLSLLSTSLPRPISHQQECVCFALYYSVHCDRRESSSSTSALCRMLTEQLMVSLKQTSDTDWDQSRSALVWLAFIGAHLCGTQREREYFVTLLVNCLMGMDITSKEQLREILLGFPYLDRVYEKSLIHIWQEMQQLHEEKSGGQVVETVSVSP